MARKMRPFVVEGQTVDVSARGFKLIRGEPYWVPSDQAARAGYTPRTLRLHFKLSFEPTDEAIVVRGDVHELQKLAALCERQWLEMLEWIGSPEVQSMPVFDGTVDSLIRCYQTDPESPYKELPQNTQRCYDDWCKTLSRAAGKRRVDRLDGRFFRKLFKEILEPAQAGGAPRVRLAIGVVKQMLPILLSYGVEIGIECCIGLRKIFGELNLRVPKETREEWQKKKPQRQIMEFAHAEMIVEEGIRQNTLRSLSVAIGVAAQFEFTIAQIDVIGWWEKRPKLQGLEPDALVVDGELWRPGLRYEDFLPDMELDLSRSKTGRGAVFDVDEYPLFMRALEAVPADRRTGPVAIDNHGKPFFGRRAYVRAYHELAAAAGVPKQVWNMTGRHGGLTEGRNAGVTREDLRDHGQHATSQTTEKFYIEPSIEPTRRVIRARVAQRQKTR